MRSRLRWFLALAVLVPLTLAGCVSPAPPPGEPVPALIVSIPGHGPAPRPVAGTVTISVEARNFSPGPVSVWFDRVSGPAIATDSAAPFSLPIDTTKVDNGAHTLFVSGGDGTYSVLGALSVRVDNRQYDWSNLDSLLAATPAQLGVPGVALVVAQHGSVVYQNAFGSYTANTVVPIASASKWLSAATIMTLVDAGDLSLDAPISRYLPTFTGNKASITLRQLLSFTSGVEEDPSCVQKAGLTLRQCADAIAALPLAATPGAQYRYGSGHLVVAAAAAESVTGESFTTLFQQRVAQPLGMTQTSFAGGANPNPAGSARSSMSDYLRFVRAMWTDGDAGGTRLLSEQAVSEMQRDQTGGAPIVVATQIRKALGSRYGFGEWYDVLDPAMQAYEVSSPGTFGFRPWIDRQRDIYAVYVVYSQSETSGWTVEGQVRAAIDAASP